MVKRAIRMGYDTVGINIDLGDISDYYTEVSHVLAVKLALKE